MIVTLASILSVSSDPKLPPYLVDMVQERTLFAQNEPVILYFRLGNQSESVFKPKNFPAIFECLRLTCGEETIPMIKGINDTKLREKIGILEQNAHVDIPLNLSRLFPDMAKGGIFELAYQDAYYHRNSHKIEVLALDLPDPDSVYRVETSLGSFVLQLEFQDAPNHARNFSLLAASGFYHDMEFFRVVRKKVVQTGDPQNNGLGGSGFPLKREYSPFLKHEAYSLGMARAEHPDSAQSQFYLCLKPMPELDQQYTVFGRVIEGFEVVDQIGNVGTTGPRGNPPDKPFEPVTLKLIEVLPASP